MAGVHRIVAPALRQDALGREIGAVDDIADVGLDRVAVERGEEGMVLRDVLIGDVGAQEGELEVLHRLPVDDMGDEVEPELGDDLLDVLDGELGIPAGIDMHDQRAQAPFDGLGGEVGGIDTTGEADDAIVFLALAIGLDLGELRLELGPALWGRFPVRSEDRLEITTMAADAGLVEGDVGVGRIHHAAHAHAVGALAPVRHPGVGDQGHRLVPVDLAATSQAEARFTSPPARMQSGYGRSCVSRTT